MAGFDIATLVEFEPPAARCVVCLGLWTADEAGAMAGHFECPVCETSYVAKVQYSAGAFPTVWAEQPASPYTMMTSPAFWSGSLGSAINLGSDPLDHARVLAERAARLRAFTEDMPPLRGLMHLLLGARSFVHVTTFGLDLFMLALLETVAQQVPIYVLASGLDKKFVPELEGSAGEAPDLTVRVGGMRGDTGDQNHGKLIVIDGILAIMGSANFTYKAWRKAAARQEIVDVVSDVDRVRELNNSHFSPLWASHPQSPQEPVTSGYWTVIPHLFSLKARSAVSPGFDEEVSGAGGTPDSSGHVVASVGEPVPDEAV